MEYVGWGDGVCGSGLGDAVVVIGVGGVFRIGGVTIVFWGVSPSIAVAVFVNVADQVALFSVCTVYPLLLII